MKQILQSLRTGAIDIADVPAPEVRAGHVLIGTTASMISAGTERMLVEFGKGSLLAKARAKPDKVKQVLNKLKTDGVLPTLEAVFAKLDEPLPLGYCNVGRVLAVGVGVEGFEVGERVVSNGAHAQVVCVPKHLCARVPEGVEDEEASAVVLGSIGLQGVRLIDPTLGERVVVVGLGLIGLMSVQLLVANGCEVLGVDLDPARLALAKRFGAKMVDVGAGGDVVNVARGFSGGVGVDAVLITASAAGNTLIQQAAQMCRKRGRVVLVGVVGLDLDRADFYEKELTFQVSCSYGPGRYDPEYEERGHDYPLGFVRWTEQRNFEAILGLMASGRLDVGGLISHRVPLEEARRAYEVLSADRGALGIVLQYPQGGQSGEDGLRAGVLRRPEGLWGRLGTFVGGKRAVVGLIGSGNFAQRTMLPALKKSAATLHMVASRSGVTAYTASKKFNIPIVTSDYKQVLADPEVNIVMITTRHDLHGAMVVEALEAGKHVMVEKPLCLGLDELAQIERASAQRPGQLLHVGFNRRYAPHVEKAKALLRGRSEPLCVTMTVNAGVIPKSSWVHDPKVGGGRIVGEACHWVDLSVYLVGSPIVSVSARHVGGSADGVVEDKMSALLTHADGSISTIHYFGNGHPAHPKERVEVFGQGRTLLIDNFRKLEAYGWERPVVMRLMRQDKGHEAQFRALCERVARGGEALQSFEELKNVTLATLAAVESARTGQPVAVEV